MALAVEGFKASLIARSQAALFRLREVARIIDKANCAYSLYPLPNMSHVALHSVQLPATTKERQP